MEMKQSGRIPKWTAVIGHGGRLSLSCGDSIPRARLATGTSGRDAARQGGAPSGAHLA
jgi:hypothetical protein